MDRNKEKTLLMIELDEYFNRLEVAELYDNVGDREWYREMISFTQEKLASLEVKS